MITKFCFVLLTSFLLLNHVSGHRVIRNLEDADIKPKLNVAGELDTQMGCKYLPLAKDETVLFTKDGGHLEHTTMALLSDKEIPADQNPSFGMNFAVQSASDLRVLLFTRRHYVRMSHTERDYEIALGTYGNTISHFYYTALSDKYENVQSYDMKNSTQLLSADKYEKFYITINDGTLKYGEHCVHEPIGITKHLGLYRPDLKLFKLVSNRSLSMEQRFCTTAHPNLQIVQPLKNKLRHKWCC